MKIIDISRALYNGMPVYPNNPAFELRLVREYEPITREGREGSQLSVVSSGVHNGTHVDGPAHCGLQGGVENWPLEAFYGKCRVVDLQGVTEITETDLLKAKLKKKERVLLKTVNSKYEEFRSDFVYLTRDAAEFLVEKKTLLVGTDGFSVQKRGSLTQEVHKILLNKMPVVEGLRLHGVKQGSYTLCAFPLAMQGDGALVRAVLLK